MAAPLAASVAMAAAKLGAAGHCVICLDKYTVHANNLTTALPFDATHPPLPVNTAMAWELWSIVADAIDDEER